MERARDTPPPEAFQDAVPAGPVSSLAPGEALPAPPPQPQPIPAKRFSVGATFLGWAVAAFFTIALLNLWNALFGDAGLTDASLQLGAIEGARLTLYLSVTLIAYVIGGYAAGRIALWDGVKHGLGIVVWSVVFALVALSAGPDLGIAGLRTEGGLSFAGGLAILLTLAAQAAGASLGGAMGARYHDRVHGMPVERLRIGGRPL